MKVKLECIDEESFLNVDHTNRYINQIVLDSSLCVEKVCLDDDEIILKDCDYSILFEELKYFKIKEPTFNDLIDVATKAVKDGLIEIKNLTDSYLEFNLIKAPYDLRHDYSYNSNEIDKGVDFIKRLYKFTINNVEYIKRIKEGDVGMLANGNEFEVIDICLGSVKVLFKNKELTLSSINILSIFELKGSIINNY